MNGGPARGLFQMEMATHDDIWENYLKYRSTLANAVRLLKTAPNADAEAKLENNDIYAAAMARIHYRRAPTPLPATGQLEAMAAYWKLYYNTPLGAGTVTKYIEVWKQTFGM